MKMYKDEEYITLVQAVNLLSRYDIRERENARIAKDRTRQLIKYHVKKGGLPEISKNLFLYWRLIYWANTQKSFKDKLDSLLGPLTLVAKGSTTWSATAKLTVESAMPETLEEALDEIRKLRQINSDQFTEIQQLRPQAMMYQNIREKSSINAKKTRKV